MQNETRKTKRQNADRGYYIALILCVVAVGISGYLFTTSVSETPAKDVSTASPTERAVQTQRPTTMAPEPLLPAVVSELPETVQTPQPAADTPEPTEAAALTVLRPIDGTLAQGYSMDRLTYNTTTRDWRTHDGVDYAAPIGTAVLAAADGIVQSVYEDDLLGVTVTVSHADGYLTRYSNLAEEVAVQVGDTVRAGDTLGTVGGTAMLELAAEPHLHFAVTQNGSSVDPTAFLSGES